MGWPQVAADWLLKCATATLGGGDFKRGGIAARLSKIKRAVRSTVEFERITRAPLLTTTATLRGLAGGQSSTALGVTTSFWVGAESKVRSKKPTRRGWSLHFTIIF